MQAAAGAARAHGAPRSTMPGSTAAAAKRCSKASARGTQHARLAAADHGEPAGVDVPAREHRVDDRRQHVLPVRPRREPQLEQRGPLPRAVEGHPVVAALARPRRRRAPTPRRGSSQPRLTITSGRGSPARPGRGRRTPGSVVPSYGIASRSPGPRSTTRSQQSRWRRHRSRARSGSLEKADDAQGAGVAVRGAPEVRAAAPAGVAPRVGSRPRGAAGGGLRVDPGVGIGEGRGEHGIQSWPRSRVPSSVRRLLHLRRRLLRRRARHK